MSMPVTCCPNTSCEGQKRKHFTVTLAYQDGSAESFEYDYLPSSSIHLCVSNVRKEN